MIFSYTKHSSTLLKQNHKSVWTFTFKTRARRPKLFLIHSSQNSNFVLGFSGNDSFLRCQFSCILMKAAFSRDLLSGP